MRVLALCLLVVARLWCLSVDSLRLQALSEGYWGARIDSAAAPRLERGPLFRLRGIAIVDEIGAPLEGYSGRGFVGSVANRENVSALQTEIRRHLLNHGFPFAVIQCRLAADSLGANAVDAAIRVQRGEAFKLGAVKTAESRTHVEVLRRLALWKIGEPFSRERLDLGLQRLRRTGYFDAVELGGLYRDSTRNLLYPALKLEDAHGNRLGGLLGYDSKASASKALTGFLDIHLVNLFGTARDFDFSFENRTGSEREARMAYVEPWIFGLPVGARLELSFLQQDSTFWEWNRNVVFFQDLNFTSRLEIQVGSQENDDVFANAHTEAIQSGLRVLFDSRDRVPFTRSGWHSDLGVTGWRRDTRDSSYYFSQWQSTIEGWVPFTDRLGAKLGLRLATDLPLSDHPNRGELFYVGGARVLRGYREREFPTNAYALGDFEFQLALGRRGRLFAFGDPGLVNRVNAEYYWRKVFGYGAGVELSKGDWSVAVAYALNPERNPGDGLLHVSVDNRF